MKKFDAFIAVDVETTGLDFETERLIEIAGARFENGRITAEFEAFLAPGKPLTAVSKLLTGLNETDLAASPPIAGSLQAFLDFAGDLPLVAHNAEFDATFFRRALEREGLPSLPGPWLDSLLLARIAFPEWDRHRLDYLSERLGILRDAEHRALPDARRAGHLFLIALKSLRASLSEASWKTLQRLAEDLPGWDRVFSDPAAISSAPAPRDPTDFSQPAGTYDSSLPLAVDIAAAIAGKKWIGFETAPADDETFLGLHTALQIASSGSRVLLCVPDGQTWDSIRKQVWPAVREKHPGVRLVTLAEPQGYLCRERLRTVVENPSQRLTPEERPFVMPLVGWADRTSSSLIAECRGFSPDRSRLLWSRVRCDVYGEDPGARSARAEADSAHVVVVTHAALCSHLRLDGALLPACDVAVLTGSHRLPETARRIFTREVSFFRLHNTLQLLRQSREQDCGLWPELESLSSEIGFTPEEWESRKESWFETEKNLQRFFQKLGRQAAKRRQAGESRMRYVEPVALAFGATAEPVLSALKDQEIFLQRCAEGFAKSETRKDRVPEVHRLAALLRAFRTDLEKLCDARDAGDVYWLEDFSNPHKAALRSTPVQMDAVLGSRLRALFDGGVFLSPAMMLAGPQPAEFFLRSAGMQVFAPGAEADVETESENQTPVLMRRVPDAHPPRFLMAPFVAATATMESGAAFAKTLFEAAAPFSDAGVFVFFPSVGALRTVYSALRALLPSGTPLWAQHVEGGKDALNKLFASSPGGWVLATEGMDLRDAEGRAFRLAIVARMPLPSSREPLWEAQADLLRAGDRNLRYELWHPSAALRLKRELLPLRAGGELKVIWLLDARASGEGLGGFTARSMDCEPETCANLEALQTATRAVLSSFG